MQTNVMESSLKFATFITFYEVFIVPNRNLLPMIQSGLPARAHRESISMTDRSR